MWLLAGTGSAATINSFSSSAVSFHVSGGIPCAVDFGSSDANSCIARSAKNLRRRAWLLNQHELCQVGVAADGGGAPLGVTAPLMAAGCDRR